MSKYKVLLIVYMQFLAIFACASNEGVLYWYVAASISKAANAVADKFNDEKHDFKVFVIPGGSGELISQIAISKKGDLFTPASEEFLTILKDKGMVKSYRKLIKQTPVFALSKKNQGQKITFNELVESDYKIAIGNPNTMALALIYKDIENQMPANIKSKLRKLETGFPLDVNQSVTYLKTNTVDAALLFDTVARINNLIYIDIPEKYNIETYAYLAVLKTETSDKNTEEFISFIFKNKDIFTRLGYSLVDD